MSTGNWYVGTDWSVIPAGGNSLRQVFVRLEDYEALAAENIEHWAWREKMGTEAQQAEARIAALEAIIARNDTTESFKCSECGAWHVRKPTAEAK